jgi:hypothetical protein
MWLGRDAGCGMGDAGWEMRDKGWEMMRDEGWEMRDASSGRRCGCEAINFRSEEKSVNKCFTCAEVSY